ncbi:MAG: nuclear transport factor 2 family protein [Pseudomonadales bacterium]
MTESAIHQVIRTYFESMHESSAAKVHEVFHPSAKIAGYLEGEFTEMSVEQFANLVAGIDPSPKAAGAEEVLEVVSLEIAGKTAVARVRDAYLGSMFLDTLAFIEVDGRWFIYNKLFHVES